MDAVLHFDGYTQLQSAGSENWDWDANTRTKAQGFLHYLTYGRTIIALVILILNHDLDIVKGLSAKLQKRDADIVMAYKYIDLVMSEVHDLRTNTDTSWKDWYREAEDLARKFGSELKVPRITTYQQHRLNMPLKHLVKISKDLLVSRFLMDLKAFYAIKLQ